MRFLTIKSIPYIGIIILLIIVLLQNNSCENKKADIAPDVKIDTVVQYIQIHDTIPGKPKYISTKIDTSIWMKKEENIPDTTYKGLLSQYKSLGNSHFSTNVFKTDFKIADYGSISITDSIKANQLVSSTLTTDLNIPVTTITIEKPSLPKNQMYIGTTFTGSKYNPISGVYLNGLLKNKKDKIYGIGIGYNGNIQYSASLFWKLKLKK